MDPLRELSEALCCLPGIGPRSAERVVFHLLKHQRKRGLLLAECLKEVLEKTIQCSRCNNYSLKTLCHLCADETRDKKILCVVELPTDLAAIEKSRCFNGYYFVLMGKISPMNGVGEEDLELSRLVLRVQQENVEEVILALSPSIEGQITSDVIARQLAPYVKHLSQPAQGIPSGSEFECLDSLTIRNALQNRGVLTS